MSSYSIPPKLTYSYEYVSCRAYAKQEGSGLPPVPDETACHSILTSSYTHMMI